jgi:histidinol-phosphate aminotransferase
VNLSPTAQDIAQREGMRPVAGIAGAPYTRQAQPRPIDLALDANEGLSPPPEFLASVSLSGGEVGTYPSAAWLEALLAEEFGMLPENVVVTAGADDALERACRATLCAGRNAILTDPTFEMLPRWIDQLGAERRAAPWLEGPFPGSEVAGLANEETGAIFVVSPNNPTGLTAEPEDVFALADAVPGALIVYDLAYVEFADRDPTREVLCRPNVMVTRTFSKAWGLAGLRVGFAIGPAPVIGWLRRAGLPYACSGVSAAIAGAWRQQGNEAMARFVATVRQERALLTEHLRSLGAVASESQGNFVLSGHTDSALVADLLAGLGIGVRRYPTGGSLGGRLRITVPGRADQGERLRNALSSALSPRALLFDMDGVLADVSTSYRAAIVQTEASFGVDLSPSDVRAAKAAGGANNDWELTHRLLAARGVNVPLSDVIAVFERLYQGAEGLPGLRQSERLLWPKVSLQRLAERYSLAIVTGRPRADAMRFLDEHGLTDVFPVVVTMEDAPAKPNPAPVLLALQRLGVREAWLLGDTVDDVRAARAAGVVPIGYIAPGEPPESATELLLRAGAARVLAKPEDLQALLSLVQNQPTPRQR